MSRVPMIPILQSALVALLALCTPAFSQSELIVNGGFETGDLTGWTQFNSGSGGWAFNSGTFLPPGTGGSAALPPISGSFDIVTFQTGPGLHQLSQGFTVPGGIANAVLSWSDRIRNFASVGFSHPNQEFRVELLDSASNVISQVFTTNPGDPTQQVGPNNRSFDLTTLLQSLGGQAISIRFTEQDNQGFFNLTLDNISLKVTINGPLLLIAQLKASLQALIPNNLPASDGAMLSQILDLAKLRVTQGLKSSAIALMRSFNNYVSRFITSGALTSSNGQPLIDQANKIIVALGP